MDQEQTESIRLYFQGDKAEIRAETLGVMLQEAFVMVEAVGREVDYCHDVDVKVRGLKFGSVDVWLELVPVVRDAMFAMQSEMVGLKDMISVISEVLALRKFLKGKEPDNVTSNGSEVTVTGENNTTINVTIQSLNIYGDHDVGESITRQFEKLDQDKNVKGFSVKRGDENLFESDRDDFESIARAPEIKQIEGGDVVVEKTLYILKPVLEPKEAVWRFLQEGTPISARMKDKEFLKKIELGEKFAMGDRLQVKMEQKREYLPGGQTFQIKKRNILKVLKHYESDQQQDLA